MKPSPMRPQLAEGDILKRVLVLVDYSNILYRSYFSSIKGWDERPWLPVLRFIDSLRLCVQRSRVEGVPLEVIFAGESRKKLERTKIDDSYKSQRVPVKHDVFKKFRTIMARVLEDMDTSIVSCDGAEADDVIASIVKYICPENDPPWLVSRKVTSTDVIIFSNDKDLYQLLRFDRCYIYKNPGVFYTVNNFEDDYGFHPYDFTVYKAMVGDKSDNISGVNGIGPVTAAKYISEGLVPVDDPTFIEALKLVQLDYSLDVPTAGDRLRFDFNLSRSKNHIFEAYEKGERAFKEIQLSLQMLDAAYYHQ